MYWIKHLTPQPSRYDGREQLRYGLRPKTWQVDQTRLYQTPLDDLDRALRLRRRDLRAEQKGYEECFARARLSERR